MVRILLGKMAKPHDSLVPVYTQQCIASERSAVIHTGLSHTIWVLEV